MKPGFALLALLVASTTARAQDIALRQEAVTLLERANAASTPANLPNLERIDTFRVLDAGSGNQEGSFTRVVIQGTGTRDETTFGSYHAVNVLTQGQLATSRTGEVAPPEVATILRLTPIWRIYFDHEDVIHSIAETQVDGRTLRCISFDTIAGEKTEDNQVCVDPAKGTVATLNVGDELIEYSNFFPFAGALMPGKITYTFAGVPKLEITQMMTPLTEVTPNVLEAPPNAEIRRFCTTFRRAFGQSMPQPKPGNGPGESEVVLRGLIGTDGRVHEAVVQSSERPELDREALSIIQQWVFTPSMCNGQPNAVEASFYLHFQGR